MSPAPAVFDTPRYGAASLADLAPSVLASLGVPGEPNVLGLVPSRRACVLLVDGMGWEALRANREHAPFLASLLEGGGPLTAGFPTTTATSLTSFGTGAAPGHHGILGYQVAVPGHDRVMNSLSWDPGIEPEEWQPRRTVYQRAEAAGVHASYVAAGMFEGSGFSRASARGSRYVAADGITALLAQAEAQLHAAQRCFVFVYHSALDSNGHHYGVDSSHWRHHLALVDRFAERLAAVLPPDAALYITADHGMVDIGADARVDVESDPELNAGVRVLAGEARARQVYTRPGATPDVLAAWRERLEGRAVVVSREEAIAEGWFGPVGEEFLPRIGDVLALAHGDTALVAPEAERIESALAGHHGSLTPAELRVPLLRFSPEG
ncbi:alkaline phosphatase family protein [Marinactinospora thermotolerans]|uniref:Uncharacterized proteins of the AP superfamily n=1 Tax=Marinactinospora thermotolerans DSM 45154 TaxID=1122192 RepID=A0A1T4SMA9_9ACTN|nr:nucleotide pyrophosphatase/phosphodiesterase family protein [Marinactinospora thermotolerans]SKA29315.1 Uncharacterized proteins of the AP superfamily [Marinactinospora thermotolerans DSM 45154]